MNYANSTIDKKGLVGKEFNKSKKRIPSCDEMRFLPFTLNYDLM